MRPPTPLHGAHNPQVEINNWALLVMVGHRSQVLGHSLALLQVLLCFLVCLPHPTTATMD